MADRREGVSFSPAVDQAVKLSGKDEAVGAQLISPLVEEEEDEEEESLASDVKKSRGVTMHPPLLSSILSCNSQFNLCSS